jgi:hypothetical protein
VVQGAPQEGFCDVVRKLAVVLGNVVLPAVSDRLACAEDGVHVVCERGGSVKNLHVSLGRLELHFFCEEKGRKSPTQNGTRKRENISHKKISLFAEQEKGRKSPTKNPIKREIVSQYLRAL